MKKIVRDTRTTDTVAFVAKESHLKDEELANLYTFFEGIEFSLMRIQDYDKMFVKIEDKFKELPHSLRNNPEFLQALSLVIDLRLVYEAKHSFASSKAAMEILDEGREKLLNSIWDMFRKARKWDADHAKIAK